MTLRCVAAIALVLLSGRPAEATWSIVAVDPVTRQVGSAGASCTPVVAGILDLVPGRAVIVAQALSNQEAKRRGRQMLADGAAPSAVLATIASAAFDPDWQRRQYGIAVLGSEAVAFTGAETFDWKGDRQGSGFSVQGNLLTGAEVIEASYSAFVSRAGSSASLAERLLAALEAGSAAGGDRRCGSQTATSAYLVVANPDDTAEQPAINVVVSGQPRGEENAVTILRRRFEEQ